MRKICLLLRIMLVMVVAGASMQATAQSFGEVYAEGNVRIIQKQSGWQVMHFAQVVGHGEGILDIDNLPPAFRSILDYYATLPKEQTPARDDSKGNGYTYGPLLNTKWDQSGPYNDLLPRIAQTKTNGETYEARTYTGCATTATAQILNYYGYCSTINKKGFIYNENLFSSVSDVFGLKLEDAESKAAYYQYSYNIDNYTPNFSKIRTDNYELAKFFYAISLLQGAHYGIFETSAYTIGLYNQAIYGYKLVEFKAIASLEDDSLIEKYIKEGSPVLINGENEDGVEHAYIIDGYNESNGEFHINYGWAGLSDGWFLSTLYPLNMQFLIVRPDLGDFAIMQHVPKYVHISGNGIDKDYAMEEQQDLQYAASVELQAGYYDYYFVYEDDSRIAPYTNGVTIFSKKNTTLAQRGTFVSSPARFSIQDSYTLSFCHNAGLNEIALKVENMTVNISGKVTDDNGKGIEYAMVTFADTMPKPTMEIDLESDSYYSNATRDRFSYLYSDPFQLQKKNITAVEFNVGVRGNPTDLTVRIMDKDHITVWEKNIPKERITNDGWTKVVLDNALEIEPGYNYRVALKHSSDNAYIQNNYYLYHSYVAKSAETVMGLETYEELIPCRVWTSDEHIAYTDEDGNYTIETEAHTSGNIHAYHSDWIFEPSEYKNIQKDRKGMDFSGIRRNVPVSGKVLDQDGNPIQGAYVSHCDDLQLFVEKESLSENPETELTVTWSLYYSYCKTAPFQLQNNYIAAVEFYVKTTHDTTHLEVSILKNGQTIWLKKIAQSEIIDGGWTKVELEKQLKIEPDAKYYVALRHQGNNQTGYFRFYLNDNNQLAATRVWTSSGPFVQTDSTGNYAMNVERYSSGKLFAKDGDSKFNTVYYTNIQDGIAGKNFRKDSLAAAPVAIAIDSLPQTSFVVGTWLKLDGGFINVKFNNNTSEKVAIGDATITGFDNTKIGKQTLKAELWGLTTTFDVTVVDKTATSIAFASYPTQNTYFVGRKLNLDGGTIAVRYDNNTSEIVALSEAQVSGFDNSKIGWQTLTVDYRGLQTDFAVAVIERSPVAITVIPAKFNSILGDELNTEGIVMAVAYDDNSTDTIPLSEAIIDGYDNSKRGWRTLTVKYLGLECTCDVYVDYKAVTAIEMAVLPTKLTYTIGNELELDGGFIYVYYNNNTTDTVPLSKAIIIGFDSRKAAELTLRVRYQNLPDVETSFKVTITDEDTPQTATEDMAAGNVRIWSAEKTIVVENATDEIRVYDAMGRLVCRDTRPCISTEIRVNATGVYIVKVGGVVERVGVR